MTGAHLAFVAVALAVACGGCALGVSNQISEGHEGASGIRRVLLCPPNLVVSLRAEIQSGAQPIESALADFIARSDRSVGRLDFLEGRRHWKQAVLDAKAAGAIQRAAAIFVGRLAQDHAFDAVVMPSLILLRERADYGEASWDGVSRKMRVVNAPSKGAGREDSTFTKGLAYGGFSGEALVTSLHLLVFTRDGAKIFEGRGGIDFVQQADLILATKRYQWQLVPNATLFKDPAILRESVAQAFDPLIEAPED